jgi:hypothetical protein
MEPVPGDSLIRTFAKNQQLPLTAKLSIVGTSWSQVSRNADMSF